MGRHLAPPVSDSWSPGAAWAIDSASLTRPLRVDRNAEMEKKEKKVNGWMEHGLTQHQGTRKTTKNHPNVFNE
jgi:hypothetical protein